MVELRNDEELWRLVGDGNVDAFGSLFDRHCGDIYRFALRRLGSAEAAEDLVAAVFLEAWRQRNSVSTRDESLRPWLFGVASNLVRREWRSVERSARAHAQVIDEEPETDHAEKAADSVDAQRRLAEVQRLLGSLPEQQREVLLLWAWEELSYDEISIVLNIPPGTVRSRLNRARSNLEHRTAEGGHTLAIGPCSSAESTDRSAQQRSTP